MQVKAKASGKGITKQLIVTAQNSSKVVIGYLPNANPTSILVRTNAANWYKIFTNLDELIRYIGGIV